MIVAVMGASGNNGRKISELLLDSGVRVRAIGRSREKLASLERAGAEVFAGDAADEAFLTEAFRGSDALYTMLSSDVTVADYHAHQAVMGMAIAGAIRRSGVGQVVCLSSIGADQLTGSGPVLSLRAQEQRLAEIPDLNVLTLRPTAYFENFYGQLPLIREHGIIVDAVAPERPVPMIATRDIAAVAAEALRRPDWRGFVVRELLGERDLTFAEATRIIGQSIGRPDLRYVQLSPAEFALSLTQAGFSEDVAHQYAELSRGIDEGRIKSPRGRTPESTTPTRFETFAEELAAAYSMHR